MTVPLAPANFRLATEPVIVLGTIVLSWLANSEADLGGYYIHYGSASGVYDGFFTVIVEDLAYVNDPSWDISFLGDGTWYLAVSSFNVYLQESAKSAEMWMIISDGVLTDMSAPSSGLSILGI
jgi:hypothetical protein